ncbi:MAG: DoxX family protein [Candidatus Krumholzibacteriota bacterium]|nr:DoxX family protein [Candidatus Krumholzibacteriota bacterium]
MESLRDALFEGVDGADVACPPLEKRRWFETPVFILIVRVVIAAVFIYAAAQKIGKPLLFADEIKMYGILTGGPLLYIFSIFLPWLELFCALSILSGIFIRGSALIFVLLNTVFIVVISYRTVMIMRTAGTSFFDIYFDCGCGFGVTYAWKKLIEDLILLIGAIMIMRTDRYRLVPRLYGRKKSDC